MIKLNKFESTYWTAGYQCCVIIYSFISFGLILVSVFNQSKLMDDEAPQFYSNWNNSFIEDIQIKQNCDHGFHNVLNFTWPGTEKGCDCTQSNATGNYKYNNYYYMECSQFMLAENCHPIEQMESRKFLYLPFISQTIVKGFQICAKFSSFTAIQAFSTQENIQNYKKCGNIWNIPITSQCPISNFIINTDNNGIQIGDSDLYYNYQRVESEEMPITQFTIGYNSICFKNTEIFIFYYLDNLIDYQCDIEDNRFKKVQNNILYSDLLKVNKVLDQYTKLFKNIQIQERNMNLFYKKLTRFQYDQCKFNDLDFMYHLNSYIKNDLLDIQLAAQVIVGIQAGVFGFFIPIISAISLIGCNFKFNSINQKGSHYKDLFGFWLGIKMIGETVCTIILAIDMGYQKDMLNNLEGFINRDCSDSLTIEEMTNFYNNYEIKVYNYVLLNFILCIITNISDIYLTYLMCRDKHKQGIISIKKNQEQLYPKLYTSTHPDEILIKSKVQIFQIQTQNDQEKDQLQEIKIPDDNIVVRIPDE